jgi:hypothetical protein
VSAWEGSAWQAGRAAHAHHKRVCSCGAVLSQCRCMDPAKQVEVVPRGCGKCGAPPREFARPETVNRFDVGEKVCMLTRKPVDTCEHCRMLPTAMKGMRVKVTDVDYSTGVITLEMDWKDATK